MRHLILTLGLLGAIAAVVAFVSFRMGADPAVHEALAKRDALAWLRADFKLTDAQFAAIEKLHKSYSVVCEEHCRAIQDASRDRNTLKSGAATPQQIAAAEKRVQELRTICETAIAAHVREVASHMSPAQGERYLAMILPKIADFDHQAAPDLGLKARHH